MDLTQSLENYLDELSSGSPTPGGGNVSALCGVLAASLGQMVCSLTIGKKKYAGVEEEIKEILENLKTLHNEFLDLAEKDNNAFNNVMESFKLPKDTDTQKETRNFAIENATMDATIVPSEVILKCRLLLQLLETVALKGNTNSLSDAGVALSLTAAAAQGAFLNVAINCTGLKNKAAAEEFMKRSEIAYSEVKEKANNLIESLIKKMRAN